MWGIKWIYGKYHANWLEKKKETGMEGSLALVEYMSNINRVSKRIKSD